MNSELTVDGKPLSPDHFDDYGESDVTTDQGWKLSVEYDNDAQNPFEDWDQPADSGLDLSNHRDYRGDEFGEAAPVDVPEYLEWVGNDRTGAGEDTWQFLQFEQCYYVAPIYMYDHSGRTVNTTGFSCGWDSGCAGIAFLRKQSLIKGGFYGAKASMKAAEREKLGEMFLRSQVALLDDYMTGNVMGYTVEDEDGDHRDSCWGFYGDNDKSGLLEGMIANANAGYTSFVEDKACQEQADRLDLAQRRYDAEETFQDEIGA